VLIDVPSLGQRLVFPCGRWLDKDKDDGQLERELLPGVDTEETYTPCKHLNRVNHISTLVELGFISNGQFLVVTKLYLVNSLNLGASASLPRGAYMLLEQGLTFQKPERKSCLE